MEEASVYKREHSEHDAMTDQLTIEKRKPRADAVRNRERVLEAAKAVFGQGGPEASLEAVAKAAGVGIGTLYRHFPTREALFEAVYRREVEQLALMARQLETDPAPVEALRRWLQAGVEFMATKKGMAAALAMTALSSSELAAYSLERLTRAAEQLLRRAVEAGEIRDDIDAEDMVRGIVGMCYVHDRPGWQQKVMRLLDVFIDGLRRQPLEARRPAGGAASRRQTRKRTAAQGEIGT
jgi:AcrR family transcriptional regulator